MDKLQLRNGFVLNQLGDMFVVLPSGTNVKDFHGALVLNEASALIYKQLQNGKTVKEIVEAIVAEYDISPETAQSDVLKTIDSLREAGLLA